MIGREEFLALWRKGSSIKLLPEMLPAVSAHGTEVMLLIENMRIVGV